MTKVVIEYLDTASLSHCEIVNQAHELFGESCEVTLSPNSKEARAAIRFGIEQVVSETQMSAFFDEPTREYNRIVTDLRRQVLDLTEEVLNQVIVDNEERYT